MSDRTCVIDMPTRNDSFIQRVELFMDGESGTWRLFLLNEKDRFECIDFSLDGLTSFRDALTRVLDDIQKHPDELNAEVRRSWEVNDTEDP